MVPLCQGKDNPGEFGGTGKGGMLTPLNPRYRLTRRNCSRNKEEQTGSFGHMLGNC